MSEIQRALSSGAHAFAFDFRSVKPPQELELSYPFLFHFRLQSIKAFGTAVGVCPRFCPEVARTRYFAKRNLQIFPGTSGFCPNAGDIAQNVLWSTLPALVDGCVAPNAPRGDLGCGDASRLAG